MDPNFRMNKKNKTNLKAADSVLATMKLIDLQGTSFSLHHDDVLRNIKNKSCDFCGMSGFERPFLPRTCDFSYPSIIGNNYPPEGSDGRVFACHRGCVCIPCERKYVDPKKKYYACKKCKAGPETVSDVWGSGIGFPRYLIRPGVLHILSFPVQSCKTQTDGQPWELVHRLQETLLLRRQEALTSRRDEENALRLVDSAAAYIRLGRQRGLSLGSMDAVLKVLHSLHDDGLLLEGGGGTVKLGLMLPETIETVVRRVEGTVILDKDIQIQEYFLDQSPLRQKRLTISVWVADFRILIQSQLADPIFPAGSFKIMGKEDMVPTLETVSGVPVRGWEVTDGQRFKDLLHTCPTGTKLLDVIAFTDGIQVGSDSYYPTLLSVGNFPIEYRNQREAIMHVAFAEKPQVRKPRHSKVSEKLCEEQKVWKQMLQSRTLTQIFAEWEVFSRSPQEFWVKKSDGTFEKMWFAIRWGMWQCDGEGKAPLLILTTMFLICVFIFRVSERQQLQRKELSILSRSRTSYGRTRTTRRARSSIFVRTF